MKFRDDRWSKTYYNKSDYAMRQFFCREVVLMNKIAVFFADGFEEIEALAVVDILRNNGVLDNISETDQMTMMF